MKLKYLGTAAAEGIPALFCRCENCGRARELGGRNIRSRSQAIINDKILIDWPADAFSHMLRFGIDYSGISTLLITHVHGDHYLISDLTCRRNGFAHIDGCPQLNMYGSEDILAGTDEINKNTEKSSANYINFNIIQPYNMFVSEGHSITALEALHGTPHPYIYLISDGEKTALYAHDTDILSDRAWEYLAGSGHIDLVSMDCTEGGKHINYHGHMCLERNIEFRDRLVAQGNADSGTLFVINHFSHNAKFACYDDMVPEAKKYGFTVSYDGLEINI